MKATKLSIPDIILLEPQTYSDDRGFFYESYNQKKLDTLLNLTNPFVQDNHSQSKKGVLRGLHYQLPPMGQGKLVRVTQGEVYDVAVDIRRSSPTYKKWTGHVLSAENKKQLWIPAGFAHAYLVLSDTAEFLYKTTNYYSPTHERSIIYNDKEIAIDWPKNITITLSDKDKLGKELSESEVFD
jgi:dTDP-4-dehydrorhamnose 3,5-epimerase